jgi:Dirigent-like protein
MKTCKLVPSLAAVAATAVALMPAGTGTAASSYRQGAVTLRFVSVSQGFARVPAVAKATPPRLGDRLVWTDVMFNGAGQFGRAKGAQVGHAAGACTLMSSARPDAQCLITAHVPDGQIVVAGEGDPGARVSRYAVVGGIGAYAGARGTVVASTLDQRRTEIVVHLSS